MTADIWSRNKANTLVDAWDRQIKEKREREAFEKAQDRQQAQNQMIVDSYYNDQYPTFKIDYPMGCL